MSETQKAVPSPKSRENLEAEDSLLDAIHTANALTMSEPIGDEEQSIAEKVRSRMGIPPNQPANLTVVVGSVQDEEYNPAGEKVWVKAEIKEPKQTTVKMEPVAEVLGDVVLPVEGITNEEALALNGVVKGLRLAKEIGVLTQLDSSVGSINKPYTAIMVLPPVKK